MKIFLLFVFSLFLDISCVQASEMQSETTVEPTKQELYGWDNIKNRKQLINAVKNADKEGLVPNDYFFSKLVVLENSYTKLSGKEIVTYNKLLTSSFVKYVSHLTNGKLNPRELYPDWEIKRKEVKADSLKAVQIMKQMQILF